MQRAYIAAQYANKIDIKHKNERVEFSHRYG